MKAWNEMTEEEQLAAAMSAWQGARRRVCPTAKEEARKAARQAEKKAAFEGALEFCKRGIAI